MKQLSKLYPNGYIMYCPTCSEFIHQSDPQNDSRRKSVIIDDEPCEKCNEKEVVEAQQLMGRLGIKGENNGA
jgi:hypothetical protein